MNQFDAWRAGYGTRTLDAEIAYHNELEAQFPAQAHYNEQAASYNEAKNRFYALASATKLPTQ